MSNPEARATAWKNRQDVYFATFTTFITTSKSLFSRIWSQMCMYVLFAFRSVYQSVQYHLCELPTLNSISSFPPTKQSSKPSRATLPPRSKDRGRGWVGFVKGLAMMTETGSDVRNPKKKG